MVNLYFSVSFEPEITILVLFKDNTISNATLEPKCGHSLNEAVQLSRKDTFLGPFGTYWCLVFKHNTPFTTYRSLSI